MKINKNGKKITVDSQETTKKAKPKLESNRKKITVDSKVEELSQKMEEAKKDIEKMEDDIAETKISLFTVFGIFGSIISFLTIEFQFFKTLYSFEKILGFHVYYSHCFLVLIWH